MLRNPARRVQTKIGLRIVILLVAILLIGGFLKTQLVDRSTLDQAILSEHKLDKSRVIANGKDSAQLELSLKNRSGEPFIGALIGLYITDKTLRSEEFSYHNWYSETGRQAFKAANREGKVDFQIKSNKAGKITYQIYQAHPERSDQLKYQPLGQKFTISFVSEEKK